MPRNAVVRSEPLAYPEIEDRAPTRYARPACGHCGSRGLVMAHPTDSRGQWYWYSACCGWESPTYRMPSGG